MKKAPTFSLVAAMADRSETTARTAESASRLASDLTGAPTRARYWVIVFAITLAIIQYIDRICISQAAPLISNDLGLSPRQMGLVFSAFTLAYALFEIPCGYLGDRIGARKVLLRIVAWWSFFTAATGSSSGDVVMAFGPRRNWTIIHPSNAASPPVLLAFLSGPGALYIVGSSGLYGLASG